MRRVRDLIDGHYAERISLDSMASTAAMSKFHFVRCFSAAYGITPAAYLAERRIERAQDLLRATNLTVTEVCMLVGYESLGTFSRTFHRIVGTSPSSYQARYASGGPRIPGCFIFMRGLRDRAAATSARSSTDLATSEKPRRPDPS